MIRAHVEKLTRAELEADITKIRAEQAAEPDGTERHERLTFMLDSLLEAWARG